MVKLRRTFIYIIVIFCSDAHDQYYQSLLWSVCGVNK